MYIVIIYLLIGLALGTYWMLQEDEYSRDGFIFLMWILVWPITLLIYFIVGGDL